MSYLRWMPVNSQELYHDAIRRLRFRIARLEGQRVHQLQRLEYHDTTEYVYDFAQTAWVGVGAPSSDPIEVFAPTDQSWLIVMGGMSTAVTHPQESLNGSIGAFGQGIRVKLDGTTINPDLWGNTVSHELYYYTTKTYTDGYFGQPMVVKPFKLTEGTHSLTIEVYPDPPDLSREDFSVFYLKDLWIRGFVQA